MAAGLLVFGKYEIMSVSIQSFRVIVQSPVGADAYIGPTYRFLPASEGGCGHPPLRRRGLLNRYRFGFGRKAEAAVHCQLTILSDGIPVFSAGVDWEPVAFEGLVDILHLDRLHRRLCKLLYKIPVNQIPER